MTDKRFRLTKLEFGVLYQLIEARGRLILREEFKPWLRPGSVDERSPVDMTVVQIRKKLGESIIDSEPGKGYRLGSSFPVELMASPSASELEKLLAIALHQMNEYSSVAFTSAIENCKQLLSLGKVPDAYAMLALAYFNQGSVAMCREQFPVAVARAAPIISDALAEWPRFGSGYALRGLSTLLYEHDWVSAEVDLRNALEYSPENALAHCFLAHLLVSRGEFPEGLEHVRIAAALDYERAITVFTEPWLMTFAGRAHDAIAKAETALKRFSPSAPGHAILGHAYQAEGAFEKAKIEYERCLEIEFLPEALASLGYVHGRCGDRQKALQSLEGIRKAKQRGQIACVPAYFDALVHAGLGELTRAIDALEKAYREKCDWLIHLGVEVRWNELRRNKRFGTLMRKVGIPAIPKI